MGKNFSGSLRMAKASPEDIGGGFDVAVILDAIEKQYYPTLEEQDGVATPRFFDCNDFDHLQHLHSLLVELLERRRGFSLFRLVMGMDTILRNNILDPDDDCLAIHPRFAQREQELTAQVDLLRASLSGIVGVRDAEQLRGMEVYVRSTPAPEEDKAVTINAIHALLATMPGAAPEQGAEVAHG